LKLKRHHFWPFAIALTIFLASGTKDLAAPDLGVDFSYDKLAHFLVFGLLATAVLRIPRFFKQGWKGVIIAVCLVSSYGALDEFRQSFTIGRSVELADWIADTLGAILASILYLKWHWYRRLWECRDLTLRKPPIEHPVKSA
jgi:VanZ family protein